jgi:hypothetical protein
MPIKFKISVDEGKSWMDAVSITAFDTANGIAYMFKPNEFANMIRWDHKEMIIEFNEKGETLFHMATIKKFIPQYLNSFLPNRYVLSGWYISEISSDGPMTIAIEAMKKNELAGMPIYKHDLC